MRSGGGTASGKRARWAAMTPEEREEERRRAEEGLPPAHWERDLFAAVRRRDGWRCQSDGCGRNAHKVRRVDKAGDPFDPDNLALECDGCRNPEEHDRAVRRGALVGVTEGRDGRAEVVKRDYPPGPRRRRKPGGAIPRRLARRTGAPP